MKEIGRYAGRVPTCNTREDGTWRWERPGGVEGLCSHFLGGEGRRGSTLQLSTSLSFMRGCCFVEERGGWGFRSWDRLRSLYSVLIDWKNKPKRKRNSMRLQQGNRHCFPPRRPKPHVCVSQLTHVGRVSAVSPRSGWNIGTTYLCMTFCMCLRNVYLKLIMWQDTGE